MHVVELGCVHATTQSPTDMKPELKDFNPLYKRRISPNDGQEWRENKHYDNELLLRGNWLWNNAPISFWLLVSSIRALGYSELVYVSMFIDTCGGIY